MLRASGKRSSLANASARSTTAAIAGGTAATEANGLAGCVAVSTTTCSGVSALCTIWPETSVNIVAPTAQRSVRPSISSTQPSACSRGMKAGVPMTPPVRVALDPEASRIRAMPKSRTLKAPFARSRKRLSGLMSR